MNTKGIPFIRAGVWNKQGGSFDGDSFRVALLGLAETTQTISAKQSTNVIKFTNQKWSQIQKTESAMNGVVVTKFSTYLNVSGCNITLTAMMSNQAATVVELNQTSTLTPLRFKYGIQIDDFPFKNNGNVTIIKTIRSKSITKNK